MSQYIKKFTSQILLISLIIIDCIIPLIIWPYSTDYFYYPKIISIYLLLILIILVLFINYKENVKKIMYSKHLIPITIFIILVFLSAAFSQYKNQAFWGSNLRYEGAITYFAYFLILYFSYLCANSSRKYSLIIKLLLVSSVVISIYAISQYFGFDPIERDFIRKEWTYSSFSSLGNPNFLGSYLSIVFPIWLFLYIVSNKKAQRTLLFLGTSVTYCALICTRTRGSWIGTGLSILIVCFIFIKKIVKNYKHILILSIVLIFLTITLDGVHDNLISSKFNSIVSDYKIVVNNKTESSRAGSERIFIWTRSLNYIFDKPLLGSGPDTFDKVFKMNSQEAEFYFGSSDIYVDKAHNEYLQIAITTGIPALLFYLYFIIIILCKSFSNIYNKKYDIYTVCLLSGFLAYIIQAFFNISVVSVAPVYWSMSGLLLGINDHKNKSTDKAS